MKELNPTVKHQVEEVLNQSFAHPHSQFVALLKDIMKGRVEADMGIWRKASVLYAQAVDNLPLCFWTQILDIAIEKANPVFHISLCQHYDRENDSCLLGRPDSECTLECQLYEGEKEQHCDQLACDGECPKHYG